MLEHALTPAQTEIYDAYAGAFRTIHHNLEAALTATGVNDASGETNASAAKASAKSRFESTKQRFFNHLLMGMKAPSIVNAIQQDLAALGLWIATLIKLQIVYLSSNVKDFVSWLSWDAQAALGFRTTENSWLDNSSVSHFTTLLMGAVTVATFGFCVAKVHEVFAGSPSGDDQDRARSDRKLIVGMGAVIIVLSANLLLIGRFEGFSLLVALSGIATSYAVRGPSLNQA